MPVKKPTKKPPAKRKPDRSALVDSLIEQVAGKAKTTRNYPKPSKANLRRERVVEGVVKGKTEPEIAAELGCTRDRVKQIKAEPGFQERINARIAEAQINTDEILGVLHSQMQASVEDFLDFESYGHPAVDLRLARDRGVLHLVKELSYDQEGRPRLKLADAHAAAVQLSRILGLDKSQQQNTTLTVGQIKVILANRKK